MRIVLVGYRSFVARHVGHVARSRNIDYLALPHDAPLEHTLRSTDAVINFALDPAYRLGPYAQDKDYDLFIARAAQRVGASFVMLSTRRVYGPDTRWDAVETYSAGGDETAYGRNKAHSEAAIMAENTGRACIFRLSNIIGYEYNPGQMRSTFLGLLLTSLKSQNKIFFDMHPDTRRDFLPVETCAQAIVSRISGGPPNGIFNLGCGFPTRCGDLANWVMEGFGGGELIYDPPAVKDEFFLNMNKWRADHDLPFTSQALHDYCVDLGKRLQCEKF